MTTAVLELVSVEKRFPPVDDGEKARPVLAGVSLRLEEGASAAIVGPSGSGKSTLLHLAGALDAPTSGRVLLAGRDVAGLDAPALAAVRRDVLGFVFQAHHLLPQCTALENVLVPALAGPGGRAGAGDVERARQLLAAVGLEHRAGHRPGQLSGGERQRVAVARALLRRPRLLLADEPTGALDGATAAALGELLTRLAREQAVALLVVTHAEPLAARMQRVLVLEGGTLRPREPRA